MAGGEREPDSARVSENDTRRGAPAEADLGAPFVLWRPDARPRPVRVCRSRNDEHSFVNAFATLNLCIVLGLRPRRRCRLNVSQRPRPAFGRCAGNFWGAAVRTGTRNGRLKYMRGGDTETESRSSRSMGIRICGSLPPGSLLVFTSSSCSVSRSRRPSKPGQGNDSRTRCASQSLRRFPARFQCACDRIWCS